MVQNSAGARLGTTPTQLALSSKESASCVVTAGPALSSKKLSRITSRHTTVVKWGRRILRRYCGTCPSSGWLFLKHAVCFFSATQWRTFYRDWSSRSAVRIVGMDAENLFSGSHAGKHVHRVQPSGQSFFILFFSWIHEFDL